MYYMEMGRQGENTKEKGSRKWANFVVVSDRSVESKKRTFFRSLLEDLEYIDPLNLFDQPFPSKFDFGS